jgi:hypothetical protein
MENRPIGKSITLKDMAIYTNKYWLQAVGLCACIHVSVKIHDQIWRPDKIVIIGSGRKIHCSPRCENDNFSHLKFNH